MAKLWAVMEMQALPTYYYTFLALEKHNYFLHIYVIGPPVTLREHRGETTVMVLLVEQEEKLNCPP